LLFFAFAAFAISGLHRMPFASVGEDRSGDK
jgi:hypothetical protein